VLRIDVGVRLLDVRTAARRSCAATRSSSHSRESEKTAIAVLETKALAASRPLDAATLRVVESNAVVRVAVSRGEKRRGRRQKVLERGPTIPVKWTPAWK
jgi:hypothetical protein